MYNHEYLEPVAVEPMHCNCAMQQDHFGREFLQLRHELRSMIEQAEHRDLESAVRLLIRSGCDSVDEILDEIVSLVGEHVEDRIEAVIRGGDGHLWAKRPDGRLQIVEAFDVR